MRKQSRIHSDDNTFYLIEFVSDRVRFGCLSKSCFLSNSLILGERLVIRLGVSTSSVTPSFGTGGTSSSVDTCDDGDSSDAEEKEDDGGGDVEVVMTDKYSTS